MIEFFLVLLIISNSKGLRLREVTDDVRLNQLKGDWALGSVADLNSDRYSDLLLVNRSDSNKDQLLVVLWNTKKSRFEHKFTFQTNVSLISSSTADFNGDGRLDVLLVTDSEQKGSGYSAHVVWGDGGPMFGSITTIEDPLQMLPLIMDFNGDHLPDLLSVSDDQQLTVWISEHPNRTFSKRLFPDQDGVSLSQGKTTAAYADINSDCLSDLLITSYPDDGAIPLIHIWLRDPMTMNFTWCQSLSLPLQHAAAAAAARVLYGPPSYIDLNADGVLDLVMMSCASSCTHPQVHLMMQRSGAKDCKSSDVSKWRITWGGVKSVNISYPMDPHHIANYRPVLGDVDLDGYPDLLVTVLSNGTNTSSAILLMNTHCGGDCRTVNNTRTRSFKPTKNELLNSVHGVTSAIFIDLWEDGIFDVLLTSTSNKRRSQFTALRQTLNEDHLFVKALVLSGFCYEDCTSGRKPYGSSLPGAVVSYQTQDRNGRTVVGMGVSTLGSSVLHNPTLPYIILGLGETPNYIEKLTIGVPHGYHGNRWHRKWELLVPNSQVILVPKPPQKPKKWTLLLYLTPSNLVYRVAGVLLAVCVGLLVVVIVFHVREKFLDRKERKRARQKFHFNVM